VAFFQELVDTPGSGRPTLFRIDSVHQMETSPSHASMVYTIDLVLIDQQSVGKRSLHVMGNVNTKKRWTTIYWRVKKFLKESHIVSIFATEPVSFLKNNDINNILFF
jgi:hypothetical protein